MYNLRNTVFTEWLTDYIVHFDHVNMARYEKNPLWNNVLNMAIHEKMPTLSTLKKKYLL